MPSLLDPQDDDPYGVAGQGLLNLPPSPAGSMFTRPAPPPVNYSDAVWDYLGQPRGQTDPNVPLSPLPGTGARVPADKMLDAPYVVYDDPPLEDQTNPYTTTYDEPNTPVLATPNKTIEANKAARYGDVVRQLPGDLSAITQGMGRPTNAPGLIAPGNINIHQRPVVRNADGSVSTVRSMTFTDENGNAVLVPSVIAGRGIVSPREAYKHYQQTGQHLGIFDTPEAADAYAQSLHEQQANEYIQR
jgi:hypothetical protein